MQPLIDGDLMLHELGWSSEFTDKDTGEPILFDWDFVETLLDRKIKDICNEVDATAPPILYISDSEWCNNNLNRMYGEGREFQKGFRYEIAKTKPYKGNRNNPKPYHFYNIAAYLMTQYDAVVSHSGLEADDMMCIEQASRNDTIICSRDKDLRICPGWHYSWECGKQAALGPHYTDRLGSLHVREDVVVKETGEVTKKKKYYGYGLKFFFFQMIAGDTADNIPGLPKKGEVAAYNLLVNLNSVEECYKAVKDLYKEVVGEGAKDLFMEQAQLLWMWQDPKQGFSPKLVWKD